MLPLLPAQEAHWEIMRALSPADPGRSGHIVIDYRQLVGALDVDAMLRSFPDVARRQESLRVRFDSLGDEPSVQIVADADEPVEFLDQSGLTPSEQDQQIEELVFHETRRAFDLLAGPLWHVWLIRRAANRHWIVLCMTHIVADGLSSKVFYDDVLAAYGARVGAEGGPLCAVPSLAEIHELQANRLAPSADRALYWRQRLVEPASAGVYPATDDAAGDLLTGSALPFQIEATTAAGIRRLAWQARTTPFVTLMAAYHLLLCLERDRSRTVLSTAALAGVTSRERRAICQHAPDPYSSTDFPDDGSLRDTIWLTRDSVAGAIGNMMSYWQVAREINPDFGTSRPWPDTHLFDGNIIDSAFALRTEYVAGLEVCKPNLVLRSVPVGFVPEFVWSEIQAASRPVWERLCGPGLNINSARDGGVLHHNRDVMSLAVMQGHLDSYLWTVDQLVQRPDVTVGVLRQMFGDRS